MFPFHMGFQIIELKAMTKGYIKVPKRRSKSKRIQKKWNKRYGYYSIPKPDPDLIVVDHLHIIVGHPKTIAKLKKAIDKRNK